MEEEALLLRAKLGVRHHHCLARALLTRRQGRAVPLALARHLQPLPLPELLPLLQRHTHGLHTLDHAARLHRGQHAEAGVEAGDMGVQKVGGVLRQQLAP